MKPIYKQVQPSVTMRLDQQARELLAAGRDIINLTAGQVDLPIPQAGKKAVREALAEDRPQEDAFYAFLKDEGL